MSRSLTRGQAILLGVIVLVGLGLTTTGLFAVGGRQWLWTDTLHVTAGFRQVRGVELGTRVRVQGVEAGEVVAVEPPAGPGGDVQLRLRLDGRLRSLLRADASAQVVSEGMIGGKVIDIDPGTPAAEPIRDGAAIAARPTLELADALGQVSNVLQLLEGEKGKVREVVENANSLLKKGHDTMDSIHQVAEGVKRVPLLRNYVEDPTGLLFRPNSECNRQCFAEGDLFEPGRAVLTAGGQQRLSSLVPWLAGLTKHAGAEVVIAAYADPKTADPALARTLTQQQSEAVAGFLKDQQAVHKQYWLIPRKLTARGFGTTSAPVPDKDPLPAARVEVLVFVPQGQ